MSTPGSVRSLGGPYSSSYYDLPGSAYPYSTYAGSLSNPHLGYRKYSSHHQSTLAPYSHASAYDDLGYQDSYYGRGSYPSVYPLSVGRPRRASSVYSSGASLMGGYSPYSRMGRGFVKFKRKGAFRSGITLGEAQSNIMLSGQDSYTLAHLNVDHRGKIFVNWNGYSPLNYEIPVDSYSGLVDLNSLARRVGRAVAHYLQANAIPVPWDRVEIQYLEEVTPGAWHLKMSIL
ncbi:hypothetical protein J3A83DRAFT_2021831 [Scleroderma citrinum]